MQTHVVAVVRGEPGQLVLLTVSLEKTVVTLTDAPREVTLDRLKRSGSAGRSGCTAVRKASAL
jgi:hypothetical protein